jgi:predicted DCC family thiol-disulfide oxidoreductase YuxK
MSLQDYEIKGFRPQFKAVDLRREIHIIEPNGKIFVGYWAVRRLFLLSPITFMFGLVLHLPFIHLIGNPVYRLIAKNRYKLNKRKCEDNSCSLFEE